MANTWIPVSERLPEYDEFVLVTANGKHNNITFEHAIELAVYAKDKVYAKDEGWILEAYPDWIGPNVTAWMPLPEPYKEQNDFWCKEDCKPITSKKKKVEKVLSNSDAVYILYADGTWMKKEKK